MARLHIPVPAEVVEATAEMEFASFLAFVRNSVGSRMFRNFYVRQDQEVVDALHDGVRSCAFFVSSVLTVFKKIGSFHTTVRSTVTDLECSGWREVDDLTALRPGDVLVWAAVQFEDGQHSHIGFCVDEDLAVSTSYETGTVVLHHDHPGHAWSSIIGAYRLPQWAFGPQ